MDVVPVPQQHTAKVLRPGAVHRTVDDYVADLPSTQFLWFGRQAEERIDLSVGEQRHRLDRPCRNPVDILDGVEPDIAGHAGQEHVLARAKPLHPYALAL